MEPTVLKPIDPAAAAGEHADLTQAVDEAIAHKSGPRVSLDQLVSLCIEKEASDLHFGEGRRVAIRVAGKISFIEGVTALSREDMQGITAVLLADAEDRKRLETLREIDLSYSHNSGVNFRVNLFYQRGKLSAVMRMISKNLPAIDALGIPDVKSLLGLRQGLLLVTGTAGSGKSTTIQSMLQYINDHFVEHIITIENPIEYLFAGHQSLFTQREIGKDTLSFANGLLSAMRQDPNVIMVSEINDAETLEQVLSTVETGHLVIASIATRGAVPTLERMTGLLPSAQQESFRSRLADNLIAILSQALVDRADAEGRVPVCELLVNTDTIPSLIRQGNFPQIPAAMQSGREEGMITMNDFAAGLAESGIISHEAAAEFAGSN